MVKFLGGVSGVSSVIWSFSTWDQFLKMEISWFQAERRKREQEGKKKLMLMFHNIKHNFKQMAFNESKIYRFTIHYGTCCLRENNQGQGCTVTLLLSRSFIPYLTKSVQFQYRLTNINKAKPQLQINLPVLQEKPSSRNVLERNKTSRNTGHD